MSSGRLQTTKLQTRPAWNFAAIERKWQRRWSASGCFRSGSNSAKAKFYNFDGGPFPNGPLHTGHVRTFTLGDVMARFQRMLGRDVLYCFEFDAFGLPNELAAQERGTSPDALTRANIQLMRRQMRRLGLSYDWRHVHVTSDPRYYRWTQWLFLHLYRRSLIYRTPALLNWCPQCRTTLAHMQVMEGRCWRCETVVEPRTLTQWFVRLSRYSALLHETLQLLGWGRRVRRVLNGFMGRTEGVEVAFKVVGQPGKALVAFARRESEIIGATFLIVAVGHPVVQALIEDPHRRRAVRLFTRRLARQPKRVRRDTTNGSARPDLSGIDTDVRVEHPLTGARLPVFLAASVDPHFATGVEPGNPLTSPRAAQFARAHSIPGVARPCPKVSPERRSGLVRSVVHYRVHDWLVSRQRCWGTPIPVVHCDHCGEVPVPEADLPVLLPPRRRAAKAPCTLVNDAKFVRTLCPRCRRSARRETDTLDCYFDVIWCFLACATRLDRRFQFRAKDFARWLPVDCFHNGLDSFFYAHLYRFIGRVLFEAGILPDPEPIRYYHGHDAVLSAGKKMSKHHGNTVAPDVILQQTGADVLRLHVLWAAGPGKPIEWSDLHIERAIDFLNAVWNLIVPRAKALADANALEAAPTNASAGLALEQSLDRTISRVTFFLRDYRYNACLEELNAFLKRLQSFAEEHVDTEPSAPTAALGVFVRGARSLVVMLAPFAPHVCEELWKRLGGEGLLAKASWVKMSSNEDVAGTVRPTGLEPAPAV